MSDPSEEPVCVRCEVPLTPVTVVDHTDSGIKAGLLYTADETPDRSMWTGALKNVAGVLHAHVCPQCRLVAWYAQPNEPA